MANLDLNEDATREALVPAWFLDDRSLGILDRELRKAIPATDPIRDCTIRDRNLILAGRTAMVAVCLAFMSASKATRERLSMKRMSVGDVPIGNRLLTIEVPEAFPEQPLQDWKETADSTLHFEDNELPVLDEEGMPLSEETAGKLVRHLVIDYFRRNKSWALVLKRLPRHICGTVDPGGMTIPAGMLFTMDGQPLPEIGMRVETPEIIMDDPDAELIIEAETGR